MAHLGPAARSPPRGVGGITARVAPVGRRQKNRAQPAARAAPVPAGQLGGSLVGNRIEAYWHIYRTRERRSFARPCGPG